mgnify:CR=1 FL=1
MRLQFPEGFLLGVSSASAQIEGGEVGSNWNDWYHQGRIKDDSDPAVADDHWNRWREDCALMAGLHPPLPRLGGGGKPPHPTRQIQQQRRRYS